MPSRDLFMQWGTCLDCGGEPLASKRFCLDDLLKRRERERRRVGGGAWRPGGPGRRPTERLRRVRFARTPLEEVHDFLQQGLQGAPVETRRLDYEQAVQEVLRLLRECRRLSHPDIAAALRLDIGTVRGACAELVRRGLAGALWDDGDRGRPFKKGHEPRRAPGKPFKPGTNSHTGAVMRRGPDLIPRRQLVRTTLLRALVMPDYRMPNGQKPIPDPEGGRLGGTSSTTSRSLLWPREPRWRRP
jgi:hypothetical protein